jgi:DNA invertase Pin-like site-specific DNA recombinase
LLVGYARVSTVEQNLDLQLDALTQAKCEKIFKDMKSSAKVERPGLSQALAYMREGDVLTVWKLDRLGRSLRDLIDTINALKERGVGFKSLQDAIDTTTAGGMLIFHIMAALAEFERALIRERTQAGLKAARARGRKGGRPRKFTREQERQIALAMSTARLRWPRYAACSKHPTPRSAGSRQSISRQTTTQHDRRPPIDIPRILSVK